MALDRHLIATTTPQADPANILTFGDCRVTVLTDRLFRIEQDSSGGFCDAATQTVWYRDMPPQSFTWTREDDGITVDTGAATLVLRRPLTDSFVILNGERRPLSNDGNLKGTFRTLDTCIADWSVQLRRRFELDDGVCARDGVAVLDDTASLVLTPGGQVAPRPVQQADWYVFAYGTAFRDAVRALYRITGSPPVIPRWALGNWWSRYYPYTDTAYLRLLDRFADRGIPLTVATVDMDWHYSGDLSEALDIPEEYLHDAEKYGPLTGRKSGWTGYTWNARLFPDYKGFLEQVRARGLRVTLNLHPADGIRFFDTHYPLLARALGKDPATAERIETDMSDPAFISRYFQLLLKAYEHDGVDFWWVDWQQGTQSRLPGLDPLWALNHYHFLDNALERDDPLILSRYAGIGSHRYPVGFSGDTHIQWETLAYLPWFTATATNAGYTWWSHDIGGHMHGIKDDELYLRFVQFGVFSPVNRLHCTEHEMFSKEPWLYENGIGLIAEEFLRLRHRLIPFLYSAACETHTDGTALIEPLYYAWPDLEAAYAHPGQYLFGGRLIAAPITRPSEYRGLTGSDVWLPPGTWTDVFTGDRYAVSEAEGRVIRMVRPLDSFPLLMPAGGVLPLSGDAPDSNRSDPPACLVFRVFRGSGQETLREDVGDTLARTILSLTGTPGQQHCTVAFDGDSRLLPTGRRVRLEFEDIPADSAVVTGGNGPLPFRAGDRGQVIVESDFDPARIRTITVQYSEPTGYDAAVGRIRDILGRLQGDNDLRADLYDRLTACTTPEAMRRVLRQTPLHPVYRDRLLEALESWFPDN